MNVQIIFLNKNLDKKIYMKQPIRLIEKGKESWACKLKKSIYSS